jgi:hypothetical protein
MDYKIDYGSMAIGAARSPSSAPLYASIDGRVASLANDEVLFHDPATDRNHVMTTQVLQALGLCRDFQPMDQHVQRVTDSLQGLKGQESAVRRVLEGLAGRGLLITDDAFLLQFGRTAAESMAPPTAIFVRACNRPEQLRRLLQSLKEHCARFGTCYRVVVVDDSSDTDSVRQHTDLLRHFGEASDCGVVYVGEQRWREIVASLGSAAPEHASAISAMLRRDRGYSGRFGGGIGKNLIGLLAAGERYLLLDDDFVFPLKRHPEYLPGLALDARAWAVRSFADHEAALGAGNAGEDDLVAEQLLLCGQTLAGAMGQVGGFSLSRRDLLGMVPSRNRALRPDARIALTINGHRGAPGASGLSWVFMLDEAGRAALHADAARYPANRDDLPVWFGTRQYLLGSGSNFTPFAVDNRRLMPPTSPLGRSEDSLFNALVLLANGDAQLLDSPVAIGHAPEGRRDRSALLQRPETPDINTCFAELARHVSADLYAEDAAPRMALFAARLDDLAGGSNETVLSYLHEYLTYRRSAAVEKLQQVAMASAGAPDFWATDLTTMIETNAGAVADRGPPRFAGWAENATRADCASAFRHEASVLANGQRAWPTAWQVALDRRESWLADAAP